MPPIRRSAFLATALLGAIGCQAGPPPEDGSPQPATTTEPKVLVIGIDGVRPDVLAEVDTPALDALIAEGSYTDSAKTGLPSVSGPGWSSFLIGVHPDKHGVYDNSFEGENYSTYPDFLTRIEQVRPELSTFAVVDWAPLGRSESGLPTLSDAIDEKVVLDGYELGWAEGDEASVELAVTALRDGDPDALFVYLGDPDESSHTSGSIGSEYRDAIARADAQVARLVEAMRSRSTYASEDWLVLVSTDHGRTPDGGHGGDTPEERTIFFLASGPSAQIGRPEVDVFIVDVAVTALAHLGIEIDPAWQLDGRAVGIR